MRRQRGAWESYTGSWPTLHTAAGRQGSPWKKMGVKEGSPRDQSLSAGVCFLA